MKKIMIIAFITIIILSVGLFSFIKSNPPLVSGAVGTTEGKKAVLVEIGNKGFSDVEIESVVINKNEQPLTRKLQVSNPIQGLIITDTFNKEASKYGIREIGDVDILPHTSPASQLEKVNNGTATENDKSYGISVVHSKPIHSVNIKYRYLGFAFEESVLIEN
ncbi:hypothetical protein E2R51_00860 [Jeotgalibacillus sp. S-D1]|uniref:hypothetical protein n=1 Tax=Jeotgalibacillus sp. S-D1 TaxID=2552189 RepID=UPI0010597985|nr:hypothetical protein [Jeotgalibacillus sp. S-D1]TDL34299.1 hypothetical protein E2R51_00860 [Jeotgalibacillus sp. S-D1]